MCVLRRRQGKNQKPGKMAAIFLVSNTQQTPPKNYDIWLYIEETMMGLPIKQRHILSISIILGQFLFYKSALP